jgi:hypothetical protein
MSVVVSNGAGVINKLIQRVYINGILSREAFLASLSVDESARSNAATVIVPRLSYYDNANKYDDAVIECYAWHQGDSVPNAPIFRGYTFQNTSLLSYSQTQIQFRAVSIMEILKKRYPGKKQGIGELVFKQRDGWSLLSILRYIFTPEVMEDDLRGTVELGSLVPLNRVDFDFVEISFPAESYHAAIWRLLGYAQNIKIVETYIGGKTQLNFVEFGASSRPPKRIVVPDANTGPAQGGILTNLQRGKNHSNVITSARLYGAPSRRMITFSTESPSDTGDLEARLIPAWPSATAYSLADTELQSNELAVMANIGLATPARKEAYESISSTAARKFCFRYFRIPEALQDVEIERSNLLQRTDPTTGQKQDLPIQVFGIYAIGLVDGEGDTRVASSTLVYREIKGARIDQGFLILPEPAIEVASITPGENAPVLTFRRVKVFVTCTIYKRSIRPYYDTGDIHRVGFADLRDNGLQKHVINENMKLDLVGTLPDEVSGPSGATYTYGCIYSTDNWSTAATVVAPGTPVVARNDTPFLKTLATRLVAKSGGIETDYLMRIPFIAQSFAPLDRIEVEGNLLTIASAQYNLIDPATTIYATSIVPDGTNYATEKAEKMTKQLGQQSHRYQTMQEAGSTTYNTDQEKNRQTQAMRHPNDDRWKGKR